MNNLQRTDEWYLLRKGKITASEIYVVLGKGKGKDENSFSQTALSYLDKKIAEKYMTDDSFLEYMADQPNTKALRWGTEHEDMARERYQEGIEHEVIDSPFIPCVGLEKFTGGSPDGIIQTDNGIIEIKCPYNPAVHIQHYMYKYENDLMVDNLQYYAQCQYNMIIAEDYVGTPIEYCDFISFDPRISYSKQMKVLRIKADKAFQANLIHRRDLAIEYMKERIKLIQSM